MKIGNLYEQIAETLGLEMGQKFNVISERGGYVGINRPYTITESGIRDTQGWKPGLPFVESLIGGQYTCEPIVEPLLSDKEKKFLKNINEISGLPLRSVTVGHSPKGFNVLYVQCKKDNLEAEHKVYLFGKEFAHLDDFYEYTPQQLGLED